MTTKKAQITTPKNENKYLEFITQSNRITVCNTNKIQADIFISLGSSKIDNELHFTYTRNEYP